MLILYLPDVINTFLNIDYRMEITSVREYSDRSESIKHIKILDDYDIRNVDKSRSKKSKFSIALRQCYHPALHPQHPFLVERCVK